MGKPSAQPRAAKKPKGDPSKAPKPGQKKKYFKKPSKPTKEDEGPVTDLPQKGNCRVFVNGLPFNEDYEKLRTEFDRFVTEWKVGKMVKFIKKDGQGFAYVCFRSEHSVPVAVRVLHGKRFQGRALRVEPAKVKTEGKRAPGHAAAPDGSPMGDVYSRQALVRDIAKPVEPLVIREVFKEYAPSLEKRMEDVKMAGGKGRKAFITFYSEADVDEFITFMGGFSLLGREVVTEKAQPPGTLSYSKKKPAAPVKGEAGGDAVQKTAEQIISAARQKAETMLAEDAQDSGTVNIYVGNLPDTVTDHDLREHFEGCGRIVRCRIHSNPHTKQSTGIGEIHFAEAAHARHAVRTMGQSKLGGSVVRIDRGNDVGSGVEEGGKGKERSAVFAGKRSRDEGAKGRKPEKRGKRPQ